MRLVFSAVDPAKLKLIPTALVGTARAALRSQGVDEMVLKDDGSLDLERLILLAFDTVEVRTSITPPWRVDLRPGAPPPPGAPPAVPFVAKLQPAVILTGRAGRAVIAPYGLPEGSQVLSHIGTGLKIAAVAGAAWLAWRWA